jgi:starvation-inducible outer membrane lipoprotein
MLLTNTQRSGRSVASAALLAILAACAENPSAIRDPGEEQRAIRCASHETLSCIEKMGKVVNCRCSSRDDLREILEPDEH